MELLQMWGELLDIYDILSEISYIEQYNKSFTTGSIKIGCDNESAGRISGILNPTVLSSTRHFSLLWAIRRLIHQLKTKVEFHHIYGHQDNSKAYDDLPRDAQINVIVDDMAQRNFDHVHEHSTFSPNVLLHHEGWVVKVGGIKLQDNILPNIRNWIAKRKLRRYLFEKDLIAWNTFPLISFWNTQTLFICTINSLSIMVDQTLDRILWHR